MTKDYRPFFAAKEPSTRALFALTKKLGFPSPLAYLRHLIAKEWMRAYPNCDYPDKKGKINKRPGEEFVQ